MSENVVSSSYSYTVLVNYGAGYIGSLRDEDQLTTSSQELHCRKGTLPHTQYSWFCLAV